MSRQNPSQLEPTAQGATSANAKPTTQGATPANARPNPRRARLRFGVGLGLSVLISAVGIAPMQPAQAAFTMSVAGVHAGATPFIAMVTLKNVDFKKATAARFSVEPKPGTVSATINGAYSLSYLAAHDYVDVAHKTVTVPVYGLYAGFANTLHLKLTGPKFAQPADTTFTTAAWWANGGPQYSDRQTIVARNANIKLGYSFFMLKAWSAGAHPVVLDTDGNVRWVGTAGNGQQGSTFVGNNFFLGDGSKLQRIGLDGSVTTLNDMSNIGYNTYHHQIDPGRDGLLLELNKANNQEADIVEVNLQGRVLRNWDFAQIIGDTMRAGGDDPSALVRANSNTDWFHNNAATYWPAKNQLVVSSRENFVIGIDYDTKQIKWILGDPTKAWHQYPSLAALALTVPNGGHYPIGQHAVSFNSTGQLMLFDNGMASNAQTPAGDSRQVSQPRRYLLNLTARTATETWAFAHSPAIYSPICSSIYQSGNSYLIDYASENWGNVRLVGIDGNNNIAFEYLLAGANWDRGWNALPIHIENLSYK